MIRLMTVGVALLAGAACGGAGAPVPGIERTTSGDTIVVRTTGDGAWGPLHDAVVVFRVTEDSPETTIGSVFVQAATPDGGVVFLDSQGPNGPIVRRFDAEGKFMHNLGRKGEGPGEYGQAGMTTLAVDGAGNVIIRDAGRALMRYAADGQLAANRALNMGRGAAPFVYATNDGSVLLMGRMPTRAASRSELPPMLRYSLDGDAVDTVTSPSPWVLPPAIGPHDPITAWVPHPDGRHLHLRTDMLGFFILDPSGGSPPLLAEAVLPDVVYLDEERDELEALAKWQRERSDAGEPQPLPRAKLPARYPIIDPNGRVWIARPATAVKVAPRVGAMSGRERMMVSFAEPAVFAAFESDGTFLGEVRFPIGAMPAFTGNNAWAVVEDATGTPRLVKYSFGR